MSTTEEQAKFDTSHFPNGPNGPFMTLGANELSEKFGGEKGIFHNPEMRDISRNLTSFLSSIDTKCGFDSLKGRTVVDFGCGTGYLTLPLAELVGPTGKVIGTEISPGFLELCEKEKKEKDLKNIEYVKTTQQELTGVPDDVADFVLLCDVYHHLEFPKTMLREMFRICKKNGEAVVVLVDFHRDPKRFWSHPENPDWVLGHLRAGQEEFTKEFEENGFKVKCEVQPEGIVENYVLVFSLVL